MEALLEVLPFLQIYNYSTRTQKKVHVKKCFMHLMKAEMITFIIAIAMSFGFNIGNNLESA